MTHFDHTRLAIILSASMLAIVWSSLIPIWQFPDEQAHFAQVQNYAETGRDPVVGKDLSAEIAYSEEKLSTLRNEQGNNAYTGHPDFNLIYSETTQGFHEKVINSQPIKTRITYVGQESPHYPPLYYIWSALGYRLVYSSDLLTRIIFVRLWTVGLFAGIVASGLYFASLVFPKNFELQASIGIAVGFIPMLMFLGSGINNDVLLILLSTLISSLVIATISMGFSSKRALALVGLITAAMLTKQTIYFLVPSIIFGLLLAFLLASRRTKIIFTLTGLTSVGLLYAVFLLMRWLNQGFWLPYWPGTSSFNFLVQPQTLQAAITLQKRIYQETFAWYWGVYRWLSLTLPLYWYQIIKLCLLLSFIGWCVKFWSLKQKHALHTIIRNRSTYVFAYLLFANCSYYLGLFVWELSAIVSKGFGHGIQGRYFFPLIASQMLIIITGWWHLTPRSLRRDLPLLTFLLTLCFNLFSLLYVLKSYYAFDSFILFVTQASQYKPWFIKWPYMPITLLTSLTSLVYLVVRLIKLELYLASSHNARQ